MTYTYHCPRCETQHDLQSEIGVRHLAIALPGEDFVRAIDFTFSAGAYAYINENTQQYVRDTQVFEILENKFSKSGIFAGPGTAANWLRERLDPNNLGSINLDSILRRLQGDGGGEVDALRQMNGSLRGLFYRTEFITDAAGHIPSNTPGIDLQVVNRFTGEIVEKIQVKSNWSTAKEALQKTIRDFQSNPHYNENTTLAGPRELIDQARQMGIPNPLVVVSDTNGNRLSGERLKGLIESHDASVFGKITFQGVAERVCSGAVVGAALTLTVSTLSIYIKYREGRLSGREAFEKIGTEASRGAVVGGAMGGLSVLFPPGAVGLGLAVMVGSQVRQVVDLAYGKGAYGDLVKSMGAIEASLASTAKGVAVIQSTTAFASKCHTLAASELREFAGVASETDAMLAYLCKGLHRAADNGN